MATETKEAKTYRPEQLAEYLGVSGKKVRAFLRSNFTRPTDSKGTSWVLDETMAKATLAHFKARTTKQDSDADEQSSDTVAQDEA